MVKFLIKQSLMVSLILVATISGYSALNTNSDLSAAEKASIFVEQNKNAAAPNRTMEVTMEHFEIPLKAITLNMDPKRIPKEVMNELIFRKKVDGKIEDYVRWIINPEDTKFNLELEAYLKSQNLDVTRYKHFTGYQQASRSWYCIGSSCHLISLKVSTNKTGGNWVDKKQPVQDTDEVRIISDYVAQILKNYKPKHFVAMDEPLAFTIPAIDQGLLLRLPGDLMTGKAGYRYIPAFSALHEEEGQRIALKNGAQKGEVAAFWNTHLNKPLARALAELFAITGLTLDSPHGQNFLVELDRREKPTGRIILKDLGDSYLLRDYFEAIGRANITNTFYKDNVVSGGSPVAIGLLHGNNAPQWLDVETYGDWGEDFFKEFNKVLSEMTGIAPDKLVSIVRIDRDNFSYHHGVLRVSDEFKLFLEGLKIDRGSGKKRKILTCKKALQ